jgi:Eco57I restriction-modification methylase/TaqI-like C-terminal specificity domain
MGTTKATFPLFHAKTLDRAVGRFQFPDNIKDKHALLCRWSARLQDGTLTTINEKSLHGEFLADIFRDSLGYRSAIQSEEGWDLHAEQTITDGGGTADAALGFFTTVPEGKKGKRVLKTHVVAPIELKSAREELDRPPAGRKESAVDQGWRYANYTADCRWVVVSNYREIRLYNTAKTPAYYERFLVEDLTDLQAFRRFFYILCRDNFLPTLDGYSVTDLLLSESGTAQKQITQELYTEYKQIRLDLVDHFRTCGSTEIYDRDEVLIGCAQRLLDRMLFIAFCEDRDLLPRAIIDHVYNARNPYNPQPIWHSFLGLFEAVDRGNPGLRIPGYNGGLFRHDPLLDRCLNVPDELCAKLHGLARFDYESDVSVDILGRIFEQSVTDLEELKARVAGKEYDERHGKRKKQGIFYTPAYVTQYIVEVSLGAYLKRKELALRERFKLEAIPTRATRKLEEAEKAFWEEYRDDVLQKTRVLDPACGSGAFLIAAFDYLAREYERVNEALAAFEGGQRSVFDLDSVILSHNLYGVDLSSDSVEITRLSLWIKTAKPGRVLTSLDNNIKVGNSLIEDPDFTNRPFSWDEEFPSVFAEGGFDVVIGNPPYIRQEWLAPIKVYLQRNYVVFDSVADLYVYFYELGLKLLKPGGILSYIVANKWLKAGYGSALRHFFSMQSVFELILDFGHAPIFEEADTFPCIIVVRKPEHLEQGQLEKPEPSALVKVCNIPRASLPNISLPQFVHEHSFDKPWASFNEQPWSLESHDVNCLIEKIRKSGKPLSQWANGNISPFSGLKTGFNKAFLLTQETKDILVKEDPKSAAIIKPFLRGQDIDRWSSSWGNLWILLLKSSGDCTWPWGVAEDEKAAEEIFKDSYPAIHRWLKPMELSLRTRQDKGHYWWELRSCTYYEKFIQPKIFYQEIQFHPCFSLDTNGYFSNNKALFLPTDDRWLLAVLNSPLMWWFNWRYLPHMKDEALSPTGDRMQALPIADADTEAQMRAAEIVDRLIEITNNQRKKRYEVFEWLHVELSIKSLGASLEDFVSLDINEFINVIRERRPKGAAPFKPNTITAIRDTWTDYVPLLNLEVQEAMHLENELSAMVNQAYGLTIEEIRLLWQTAPPRMPFVRNTLLS